MSATWNIGLPPKDVPVALVVRRWVAKYGDIVISFIAGDPSGHLGALNQDIQIEPSQTVIYGILKDEDGETVVIDEDGNSGAADVDAILAWSHVPSFAMDRAAAEQTDMLLNRIRRCM